MQGLWILYVTGSLQSAPKTRYPDQGAVGGPGQRGVEGVGGVGGWEGGGERASDKATLRPYLKHSCQHRQIAVAAVILSTIEIAECS
jgi:hypothetical protein